MVLIFQNLGPFWVVVPALPKMQVQHLQNISRLCCCQKVPLVVGNIRSPSFW